MNRKTLEKQLRRNLSRDTERICRMVRQPSVSAEGRGMDMCARLVAEYLREAGCRDAELVETDGHPIVQGTIDVGADDTLLVYMMYDTQPFDGEAWSHPPLGADLASMDPFPKVVFGRGAINTKGPMVAFLNLIGAAREAKEDLPVNLRFLCEGEEELGSPHLPTYVRENREVLQEAGAVLYPAASQDRNGRVKIWLGNKGILYVEFVCTGDRWGRGPLAHDIHSANKAWIDSPVWRLVKALATLVNADGNTVAIDGFYDEVLGPTPEEHALLESLARTFDPEVVRQQNQVRHFVDDLDGVDLLERFLYAPTLNIDGMWAGHTGPGTKTVLPHAAHARADIRLVPNQEPARVLRALRTHLDRAGFPDVEVNVHDEYDWSQTPPDARIVRAAVKAYGDLGHEPEVWIRAGGSLPMCFFTKPPLRLPALSGGLGHGGGAHAPDEYMVVEGTGRVAGLVDQELSYAAILDAYAETPS